MGRVRNLLASAAISIPLVLIGCSGGGGGESSGGGSGSTPPPPPPSATRITTESEAVRFLTTATFGAKQSDISGLVGGDASAWVRREINKSPSLVMPRLLANGNSNDDVEWYVPTIEFWNDMVGADDQLRQRMTFALSQILVVSDTEGSPVSGRPLTLGAYMDILERNAFGNYRDLLEEITYSVAMAEYLTYMRNLPGNMDTGEVPDENYAREIMQLFTIGLVELNRDGTPRTDVQGNTIPTYDNSDVAGLARVFTGLSFDAPNFWSWPLPADAWYRPLRAYPDFHSRLEKRFLDTTIAAGTGPTESIDLALDALFNHPNTPPFVSRQLIQRFTESDPDPAYVERVATVFEQGRFTMPDGTSIGTGRRGDLAATISAILLDESQIDFDGPPDPDGGKLREPVIRFAGYLRAFDAAPIQAANHWDLYDTSNMERLGQHPFRSPSVFNFYRPGFIAPGTSTGSAGITVPEFQIVNESSAIGYIQFMTNWIGGRTSRINDQLDTMVPNFGEELALSERVGDLVNHLDLRLTGGRLEPVTKTRIADAIEALPIRAGSEGDEDRLRRVQLAILMVVTSPQYIVQD